MYDVVFQCAKYYNTILVCVLSGSVLGKIPVLVMQIYIFFFFSAKFFL